MLCGLVLEMDCRLRIHRDRGGRLVQSICLTEEWVLRSLFIEKAERFGCLAKLSETKDLARLIS